jgi:hypothetical protein
VRGRQLVAAKVKYLCGQLSTETVCSSMGCLLTPSNTEVHPTGANAVNAATGIILLCGSIVCVIHSCVSLCIVT